MHKMIDSFCFFVHPSYPLSSPIFIRRAFSAFCRSNISQLIRSDHRNYPKTHAPKSVGKLVPHCPYRRYRYLDKKGLGITKHHPPRPPFQNPSPQNPGHRNSSSEVLRTETPKAALCASRLLFPRVRSEEEGVQTHRREREGFSL